MQITSRFTRPQQARIQGAGGRRRCALPRVRAGGQVPVPPQAQVHPCDAPKEKLFELRDYLGFERNVIVQASCHGTDNAALIDALETAGNLARGVAVVDPAIGVEALEAMDKAGVRGVRFNFVKRLVDSTPKEVFLSIAEKIKPLGWHIVVYFEAPDLEDLIPFLNELNTTIVVDHMGRPDVAKGSIIRISSASSN